MAGVPGVVAARVNLATQRAEADVVLAGDDAAALNARLAEAIRGAGYDAFPVISPVVDDRERREREAEEQLVRRRFLLAAGCGGAVFAIAHISMLAPGLLPSTPWQQAFAQFVLAIPVQFVAGWPFLKGLVRGLVRRAPDMDTLVGLGTLAAFAYSTWALFFGMSVGSGHAMPVAGVSLSDSPVPTPRMTRPGNIMPSVPKAWATTAG